MLLIGDKVVTAQPDPSVYRYELDLGEAWKKHTGLPFVFAIWMAKPDTPLGDLPQQLARLRVTNAERIDRIVQQYAAPLGWPNDLAIDYFTNKLSFAVTRRGLEAIERFWCSAASLGLIESPRPLVLHTQGASIGVS
jgi:chorismate dehydratase